MEIIIGKAKKEDMDYILKLQYLAYQSEAKILNDFSIQPLTQTFDEVLEEYDKGVFI